MKKNVLHEIMRNAWRMFKVTGQKFSECLRKAWAVYKLGKAMKTQIVEFYYQKMNGEVRQAFGTMQEEVIHDKVKGTGKSKMKTCSPIGTQRKNRSEVSRSSTLLE